MAKGVTNPAIANGGGLYIHVAYCWKKCIYCDFFSAGERIANWPRYVDALINEFIQRRDEMAWPLRTVYFGGGTPSLMPENEFLRLCSTLKPYITKAEEVTLEVNPDDVDENKLELWKKAGVNRLSIGIQTFDNVALAALGRRHDNHIAMNAFELARRKFDNISIDLMFGLPNQTLESWKQDLDMILRLRPEHISAYSLMYEEGTVLTALRNQGRLKEVPEELSEEMFMILIKKLADGGYDHYEISNFALPGFRSRHNSLYWLQKPYMGLGPSAHSYDGKRTRKSNSANIMGYLDYWATVGEDNKKNYIKEEEILSDEELVEEYIMTRVRMREGIPIDDFKFRFGENMLNNLIEKSRRLSQQGLMTISGNYISINEKSILLSDSVILELTSIC